MEENSNQDELKQQLAEIDDRIEVLKKQIEFKDALERLHENEDFKLVFLEGYFEAEAERVFTLLTEPTNLKRDQIQNVNDQLGAIRLTKKFIQTRLIDAAMAPEQIDDESKYRKEVTAGYALTEKE